MKLSALVAKMAGVVGARLLGAAVGFASQLVMARLMSVEDVGVVILGMSAASFISLGANGGYSLMATTQLPKLTSHGRSAAAESFNRIAVFDSMLAFLILSAAGWLFAASFGLTDGQKVALIIGFLCAPASLFIRYNASMGLAAKLFRASYVPDFLFRPAALLVGLLAASFAGYLHSALAALLIFTFVTYLTAIGQVWVLGENSIRWRHFRWPQQQHAWPVRKRAFALTLVAATMLAFADIVVVLAGFILPERDVAIVGIAMRLAAIAGFVLQAGQMLVMADFTQALVKNENTQVNALLRRINFTTVGIVGAALLGSIVLGDFALSLFGEEYRAGKWLLVLFLGGQSLRALGGMNQQILSINGFQLRTAGACLLALIVLVSLALLLSHAFGTIGIGYAVIGAEIVWLLALAAQAQELCGRRGDILWVLRQT